MKLNRKVTNFIRLEEGNIGRKAAVVTGALLASSVLGAVLTSTVEADHCNVHTDTAHTDYTVHTNYEAHDHHVNTPGESCPE
jgi:hypothetical protein